MPLIYRDYNEGFYDEGTYDFMFYDVSIVDVGGRPKLHVSHLPERITPPSPAPERADKRPSGAPERAE